MLQKQGYPARSQSGIRVGSVWHPRQYHLPGYIVTAMTAGLFEAFPERRTELAERKHAEPT